MTKESVGMTYESAGTTEKDVGILSFVNPT
jgi:hypothetical protein